MLGENHRGIGIDTPPDVLDSIAAWRNANPKGKRGVNDYSLEFFGIDGDATAELFSDYMRKFNVPRESEGVAGMQSA